MGVVCVFLTLAGALGVLQGRRSKTNTRSDPVAQFQRYNNTWGHDKYIQRNKKKASFRGAISHLHEKKPSIQGAKPKSHSPGYNSYEVPTTKKRDNIR